ncbi:MAG: P-II family nitrogen regulator [Actinobacteria bacterium]|nr:P-II family nitrogen regulator [Actinomycetota bacterium]MBM3712509.1 P-II family nitrogen regulator [Actinomycetota bacterium]
MGAEEKKEASLICRNNHDLIVTIVNRGNAELILNASKKAGAEGGTVIYGRGMGIHEKGSIMGIPIEPEKEIIFTIISKDKTREILSAITAAGNLDEPGTGVAFVINIQEVAGICHLLENV